MDHVLYERALQALLSLPPEEMVLTEAGWVMAHTHLGPNGGPTVLEDWQVWLLNAPQRYQWVGKSRQVGFSWVAAAKALARSYLVPLRTGRPYLGIFLSINREEAQNKIRYVAELLDTLSPEMRGALKTVAESRTHLEFSNGSRIVSHPARPVRGASGADIVLDEFAHAPKAEDIYRGTTAASIRRGDSTILVGSTPLGQGGIFYEMGHDDSRYPIYKGARWRVYWWDSAALCVDPLRARRAAIEESWTSRLDRASVEERVRRWGSRALQEEFDALPVETFLQEYEVAFSAVSDALIPYDVLMRAVDPELEHYATTLTSPTMAHIEALIPELERAMAGAEWIWVGYDPARKRDQAAIVGATLEGGKVRVVFRISLREGPFAVQEYLVGWLAARPQVPYVVIDVTGGMGAPLQEKLAAAWGNRIVGVTFTPQEKHFLASRVAALYSHGRIVHGGDRELLAQVSSLRKKVTASGRLQYEGSGDDHHADVFWALALAVREMPIATEGVGGIVEGASRSWVSPQGEVELVAGAAKDPYREEYRRYLRERRGWREP